MRTAVLSDIHANLTALEAVIVDIRIHAPDAIVVGGDLVGSGSRPAEVIDRIRDLGWPVIQGNADEMLWNAARVERFFAAPAMHRFFGVVERTRAATAAAIGGERLAWLRAQPFEWRHGDLAVVHASPGDAWRSPGIAATDAELERTYESLGRRLVVYGHLHTAFVRALRSLTVANSGSVSLSYDGDPRAAYALIDPGGVEIRRVEYDVEAEIRELRARGCPDDEWTAATLRAAAFVALTEDL